MNSREEIMQVYDDYNKGKFGSEEAFDALLIEINPLHLIERTNGQ